VISNRVGLSLLSENCYTMSSTAHKYMEFCERVTIDSGVMNAAVELDVERSALYRVFVSTVRCSYVSVITNELVCNQYEREIKPSDKCNEISLAFVARTQLIGRTTSNERCAEEHVNTSEIT
jgi:hypothetical protein